MMHTTAAALLGTTLLTVAFLILWKRRLDQPSFADTVVPSLILFGLVMPIAVALPSMAKRCTASFQTDVWDAVLMLLPAIITAALVLIAASRRLARAVPTHLFLLVSLGVLGAIKIGYVFLVDPPAISDFGIMWKLAGDMAHGHWPQVPSVYMDRSLAYFVPLQRLFGPASLVYKLANVASLLGCSAIAFDLARHWFDERVARVVLVLSSLAPETFTSSAIPTHDIPGALFLLLLIWLFDRLCYQGDRHRPGRSAALGLAMGVALELVELQRGLRPFWLASLGLFVASSFLSTYRRQRPANVSWLLLLCGLLVPLTVQAVVHHSLEASGIVLPSPGRADFTYRWLASCSDSWGDGTYTYAYDNYLGPYDGLKTDAWRDLAVRKLASDTYYEPLERAVSVVRKSPALLALGLQVGLYLPVGSHLLLPGATQEAAIRLLGDWSTEYSLVFEALLLVALVTTVVRTSLPEGAWPAFFALAILSLTLLLFGEVQARYLYPIWFLAPMPIGAWLTGWRAQGERRHLRVGWFLGFHLLVLGACALSYAALHIGLARSNTLYLDLRRWHTFSAQVPASDPRGFLTEMQPSGPGGHFRLVLRHPGTALAGRWVGATCVLPIVGEESLAVRVRRDPGPQQRPGSFLASVWADGKEAASIVVDTASARRLVVSRLDPKEGKVKIDFRVSSSLTTPPDPAVASPPVFFEFATVGEIGSFQEADEVPWRSEISLRADPNPVVVCDGTGTGASTIRWRVAAGNLFEVRVGSVNGSLLSRSTSAGLATTGKWIRDGTQFFLLDVSRPQAPRTLASVAVGVTNWGCPQDPAHPSPH